MRVRFGEFGPSEQRELQALDHRIDQLFVEARDAGADPGWWPVAVRTVLPGLGAELLEDGRIVIRGEQPELTPVAERAVQRSPEPFRVLSKRPARPLDCALERAVVRQSVDLSGARFRAGFTRGHLLEVVVEVPGGAGSERERRAAEGLVWDVLGEGLAETWIGAVDVTAGPRSGPLRVLNLGPQEGAVSIGLEQLRQTVENGVAGLMAALPLEPAWVRSKTDPWTLFELTPDGALGSEAQDDLLLTSTCEPEMLKCFLSGSPFSSARFSRHGELFFYLKFAAEGDLRQRLLERSKLEDSLERALVEARQGRVIGGGIGVGHSYVDFVVLGATEGLKIVSSLAREAGLPDRSWILPFDDQLGLEWLEVFPGSPAPAGLSG